MSKAKRYALVDHDNVVVSVIKAHAEFFETCDPKWKAQFAHIIETTDEDQAEPLARFDPKADCRFCRCERVEPADPDDELRSKIRTIMAEETELARAKKESR